MKYLETKGNDQQALASEEDTECEDDGQTSADHREDDDHFRSGKRTGKATAKRSERKISPYSKG